MIVEYIRKAKCKDCKFLQSFYKGKRKYHRCENKLSSYNETQRAKDSYVCDKWEL